MSTASNEWVLGLYTKKLICPACQNSFTTMKVRSRFATPQVIDSDFCPHYQEDRLNPNYYYVDVCPGCGFSYTDEFSQELSIKEKHLVQTQISAKWERREFGELRDTEHAIEAFKLAIYSATLKEEKHAVLGGLCLRLAWIYRQINDSEKEKRFLRLASKEFQDSYAHSDFLGTSLSEMKVLYLAGELNRRLSQFQEAINYFAKIIEHPNRSRERRILVLAREQWNLTAEEYRQKRKSTE